MRWQSHANILGTQGSTSILIFLSPAPHHHPETPRKLPGLINQVTLSRLPLIASEVTSCVSGYAFGMTALLTYHNPDPQALEGKFQGVKLGMGTLEPGYGSAGFLCMP